jgi:lipopolysaccharide/colanic/teichoic acid biosynthesis glycosyltransferase
MIKRFVDISFALIGICLFAPLLLLAAITIRIKLGSPILFSQIRPGLAGKAFRIYKFRSMLNTHCKTGQLLPDNQRLTPFGKLLRSTSLDELPELWNVLKGDMSLVGPRPLLMEYLERYSPRQYRRHETKPGITGWAQINGRNSSSWEERFEQDIWYVDNQSLRLDLKILILTIRKVIKRDDINQDGVATMSKFMGNKNNE